MDYFTSKRKRLEEPDLYMAPESSCSYYQRQGMGFLTAPIIPGTVLEVGPPRKRLQPMTVQRVSHITGTTLTMGRLAPGGYNRVLSDEQIHQFITSTVLPHHRSLTRNQSSMNKQYLSPEVASRAYERPEVIDLTSPSESGTDLEVEPPRKRFRSEAVQNIKQNTGSTHTVARVERNGADFLLSDEQIHQFITSTVLPHNRRLTNPQKSRKQVDDIIVPQTVNNTPDIVITPDDTNVPGLGLSPRSATTQGTSNAEPRMSWEGPPQCATTNDVAAKQPQNGPSDQSHINAAQFGESHNAYDKDNQNLHLEVETDHCSDRQQGGQNQDHPYKEQASSSNEADLKQRQAKRSALKAIVKSRNTKASLAGCRQQGKKISGARKCSRVDRKVATKSPPNVGKSVKETQLESDKMQDVEQFIAQIEASMREQVALPELRELRDVSPWDPEYELICMDIQSRRKFFQTGRFIPCGNYFIDTELFL